MPRAYLTTLKRFVTVCWAGRGGHWEDTCPRNQIASETLEAKLIFVEQPFLPVFLALPFSINKSATHFTFSTCFCLGEKGTAFEAPELRY